MASNQENVSMAIFCDFENVALGVRDAKYEKFDIKPILERLLLKGSIVVKKAYCDWDRYKTFKATMHEANFELIEIPHVRQSGKNSADIRLVVDALDLCYTKAHVDTFVIISGDSDFSPLVSKLRENAKRVIGVGVKQSTSDLLVANCDDFIFYDDLVRERESVRKRATREAPQAARRDPGEEKNPREELESRRGKGIALVVETFDALVSERGDSGKIWASVLKEAVKRRRPDFNESYFGFRTFGNMLEAAQKQGLLEFGRDEKSGAYVYRSHAQAESAEAAYGGATGIRPVASPPAGDAGGQRSDGRRTRGGRKPGARSGRDNGSEREPAGHLPSASTGAEASMTAEVAPSTQAPAHAGPSPVPVAAPEHPLPGVADATPAPVADAEDAAVTSRPKRSRSSSTNRRKSTKTSTSGETEASTASVAEVPAVPPAAPMSATQPAGESEAPAPKPAAKRARKSPARSRRPRAAQETGEG